MQIPTDTLLQRRLAGWSVPLLVFIITAAFLVLLGWQFNIVFLRRPIPYTVAMNPATAAAFILAGFSFLLLASKKVSRQKRIAGCLLAAVVLLTGLAKLSGLAFGLSWQVDHALFSEEIAKEIAGNDSNSMAPTAAFCFILTGAGLLLLDYETPHKRVPAHYIAIIIFLLGLLAVLNYIYRIKTQSDVLAYIPMAIHSAGCFILLSLVFLFRNAERGIMKEFTGPFSGSVVAPLLIPVAVIVPVVLGYLQLLGIWSGAFSFEMGTAILVLGVTVVLITLAWFIAIALNKRDYRNKQIEIALQQSEAQIQTIFRAAPDAVIVIDEEGKIVKWNPKAETLFGWRSEEVIGVELSETIIPQRLRVAHKEGLRHFIATGEGRVIGKTIEIGALTKEAVEFDVALSISPTRVDDKYLFIGFMRDITEQKKAAVQLKESEEKFQKAFRASAAGMTITRLDDSKYIDVNDAFIAMTGYAKEELIGHSSVELDLVIHRKEREEVLHQVRESGAMKNFEVAIRSKTGKRLEVLVSLEIIVLNDEKYAINIIYDITERKKAEEQLAIANKELEAFSYSVSHDLRAPLRIIDGYTEILQSDYAAQLDEEGNRVLNIITQNTRRMGKLIDDLLDLARMGRKELAFHHVDMNRLVESVIAEQHGLKTKRSKVTVAELEAAHCDNNLIRQVWINLVSNAIKYSAKKEEPVIEIGSIKTGDEIIYSVKDNGAGFDMQYAGKLFGVFQRLHNVKEYEGTGVGLALVHRIVTRHGGRVWAEAEVDAGAAFYFSLPLFHVQNE